MRNYVTLLSAFYAKLTFLIGNNWELLGTIGKKIWDRFKTGSTTLQKARYLLDRLGYRSNRWWEIIWLYNEHFIRNLLFLLGIIGNFWELLGRKSIGNWLFSLEIFPISQKVYVGSPRSILTRMTQQISQGRLADTEYDIMLPCFGKAAFYN